MEVPWSFESPFYKWPKETPDTSGKTHVNLNTETTLDNFLKPQKQACV